MSTTVKGLIAKIGGEKYKIAARIGVASTRLYEYETGRRPMPDHQLAHLASLADVDPRTALGDYAYERLLGKTKGRAASVIVGAMMLFGLSTAPTMSEASSGAHNVQSGKRRSWLLGGGWSDGPCCNWCSPRLLPSC
jgi:hypothetical protein